MMGDGTNDPPALAQADVALVMNAGTQAAIKAANMVDLDSDPTKLIEVVEIGKQHLMTRGALTTFSIGNDVAKYFAIIPALFAGTLPWLKTIDIMHLHSPTILSAVIFNALIIPARKEIDQVLQANASAAFGGLAGEKFVNVLEVNLDLCKRSGVPK
jgi:K+-transporting ATPase ATPase B chain